MLCFNSNWEHVPVRAEDLLVYCPKDFVPLVGDEAYMEERRLYMDSVDKLAVEVGAVFLLSYINFLFPLNVLMEFVLTSKTNRKSSEIGVDFINELILFIFTSWGLYNLWYVYPITLSEYLSESEIATTDNKLMQMANLSYYQRMATSIIWDIIHKRYQFHYILATLSINTWLKLLIRMQMTEVFGPQFKVILSMGSDLVLFYALWIIILLSLTSVGCLIFMDVPEY